jgi:hypothetical protein
MQSSLGLDPFTGTYDLYQGNDGYIYRTVPNGISQYNTAANADRLQDIIEPPDTHCTLPFPFASIYVLI